MPENNEELVEKVIKLHDNIGKAMAEAREFINTDPDLTKLLGKNNVEIIGSANCAPGEELYFLRKAYTRLTGKIV